MKICILYGGVSSEREVSINTGKSIYNAVCLNYELSMYDFDGDYDLLLKNVKNVDLVFNALHGGEGENGTLQKYLESKNIKFTGSNSVASKIAMYKDRAKMVCEEYNIQTPKWLLFTSKNFNSNRLNFHEIEELQDFLMLLSNNNSGLVVKPNNEGSSVGITILKKIKTDKLSNGVQMKIIGDAIVSGFQSSNKLLLEEYIPGRELTVSILNNIILPIVEIIPKGDYYDYKCKYTKFKSNYIVPAEIDNKTKDLLSTYSLKIHKLIGCGTYSRVDFRLSESGKIYFLEINTLPGFTDTSLFPKSAAAYGLEYKELIKKIIEISI